MKRAITQVTSSLYIAILVAERLTVEYPGFHVHIWPFDGTNWLVNLHA
jgi:hypothetical protein